MSNMRRWTLVIWSGLAIAIACYLTIDAAPTIFSHHISWLFGAICGAWAFHRRDV